jgi:hypothetical protein
VSERLQQLRGLVARFHRAADFFAVLVLGEAQLMPFLKV